jgi:hypothetical protein
VSTRAERKARRNAARCRNCGEFGRHYAPPTAGSPGVYICEPPRCGFTGTFAEHRAMGCCTAPRRAVYQCVCVHDDAVRLCHGDRPVCWDNGNGTPPVSATSRSMKA